MQAARDKAKNSPIILGNLFIVVTVNKSMMKVSETYAFEGINASGKSTIIRALSENYADRCDNVKVSKIGGMGDDPRMRKLKKILEYRENLRREGKLSWKQERDFKKDRIFRLAIREQIRRYKLEKEVEDIDIHLLDRTPMMSWAYSSSVDENNPYLSEILNEGLELTEELSIDTLFHFDIDPVTTYVRIICRSCEENQDYQKQIEYLLGLIRAPADIKQEIFNQSLETFRQGISIDKKPFRIWDFMPYEEVEAQSRSYKLAVDAVKNKLGIKVVSIDASQSIEEVLKSVKREIK